ncbi:hypothetical protein D3C81_1235180 [compost metagenome]
MDQVAVVLAVVVAQLGMEVGGGEIGPHGIAGAGIVETVAGHAATGAVGEHAHVLVVRRIAQARACEAAAGQGQPGDFLRHDLRALEGLRQQAGVVAKGHRQQRLVGADGEHAVGQAQLGGRAEETELIGRLAAQRIASQRPGAAGAAAGIELDAEQSHGVEPDTDGAFGEPGGVAQHEALRPFLGLGIAGPVVPRGIDEPGVAIVAVHVEVAEFQAQVAVIDEGGLGQGGDQASAQREQTRGLAWRGEVKRHVVYL